MSDNKPSNNAAAEEAETTLQEGAEASNVTGFSNAPAATEAPKQETGEASASPVVKKRGKAVVEDKSSAPEIDKRAYEQYQVLAQAVLESAENATRSAQAAANASRDLRQASTTVMELGKANHKRNQIMLGAAGGFMLLSLVFFMIMGVRMISRINELDAMILAVGKRAVELNAGLDGLNSIQQSMQDLAGKQAELKKSQTQLESRIENSLKQSESVAMKVPQETAKQVAASSNTMIKQVQDLNKRLASQTTAVQSLGSEVKSLRSATANVDNLKRDVEALITLQRERYLEVMQKNNQAQQSDRAVQFPRKDGKPAELTLRPQ